MGINEHVEAGAADLVRIVSRRIVRWSPLPPSGEDEDIHLSPWDLCLITVYYIQNGVILPKPPAGGQHLVDTLVSSFARALGRYYQFAGRLVVEEHGNGTVTVPLRCTGDGAEFVHASAPGVVMVDIVGSIYVPLGLLDPI